MNTTTTWQIISSGSYDTYAIGEQLGKTCKGGEVIVLSSDLGGGKTTLVKGLAAGLGSSAIVNSPTFMVERVYPCRDGISLHHFDFYRLQEGGMVALELAEVLEDPKAVVAVEWSDIVSDRLPLEHVLLRLERQVAHEEERKITIQFPDKFIYLTPKDQL